MMQEISLKLMAIYSTYMLLQDYSLLASCKLLSKLQQTNRHTEETRDQLVNNKTNLKIFHSEYGLKIDIIDESQILII